MEKNDYIYYNNNKILIVDDIPDNIYAIAKVLEAQNYEIDQAHSGEDALRMSLKINYGLILMDVQMPLMDGFETAQLLKGNTKTKDIPIIFLTALSKEQKFAIKGFLSGAVDYLTKPVDSQLLLLKVQVFLKLFNHQEELKLAREKLENMNDFLTEKIVARTSELEISNKELRKEIDEKKKVEKEIEKQHAYFLQLFESSPEAIAMYDNNENIISVNNGFEKLFGYSKNDIESKNISELILPKNLSKEMNAIKESADENKAVRVETKRKRSDDTLVDVEILSYPIMINNLEVGRYCLYRDITERTIMMELLEKERDRAQTMNKLKTNFLANMSHELRTPMNGILGFSEYLKDEIKDEEQRKYAKIVFQNSRRLTETLNSILDLAKIEMSKSEIEIEPINISSELPQIVTLYEKFALSRGLTLKTIIKDNSLCVKIDKRGFESIIKNLVDNAIKFTNKGGVTVEAYRDSGSNNAIIKIVDTGIGIPQKYHKVIFKEFRQVSEGLSRKYEGTGLGLAITRKLVEMMDGEIHVESNVQKGTTFTVQFPLYKVSEPAKDTESGPEKLSSPRKQLVDSQDNSHSILLVEDDISNQNVVKMFLKDVFPIDIVESGEKAIEKVSEKNYEIILMDINLGKGINGLETTQRIRNTEAGKNLPIVALTAYAMKGDEEVFINEGCTHYLSKPFSRAELLDLLQAILMDSNKN